MKKLTPVLICLLVIPVLVFAGDKPQKIENSQNLFANGIDQLLIDTAHVYVNPSQKVKGFQLMDVGVVFTGAISMTLGGGYSFDFPNAKIIKKEIITDIEIDMEDLQEDLAELAEELAEIAKDLKEEGHEDEADVLANLDLKKLEKLSKLSKLSKLGDVDFCDHDSAMIIDGDTNAKIVVMKTPDGLKEKDDERVQNMDTHIAEFKKELMELMIDFGPILKGLDGKDTVTIVFHVKDKTFVEKYGTSTLQAQIPFKTLLKLGNEDPGSPKVMKAFKFNI